MSEFKGGTIQEKTITSSVDRYVTVTEKVSDVRYVCTNNRYFKTKEEAEAQQEWINWHADFLSKRQRCSDAFAHLMIGAHRVYSEIGGEVAECHFVKMNSSDIEKYETWVAEKSKLGIPMEEKYRWSFSVWHDETVHYDMIDFDDVDRWFLMIRTVIEEVDYCGDSEYTPNTIFVPLEKVRDALCDLSLELPNISLI